MADVDEGIELRKAGINCPIQLLHQPPVSAAAEIYKYKLIPALSSPEVVLGLAEQLPGPVTIHVEIDTGMSRVGLKPEDTVCFLNLIKSSGKYEIEGLFSHFACSHVPGQQTVHFGPAKGF